MKVGQHTNLVLLAAAAVAAVVWGGSQARQKVAVQNRLEAAYRESFASVIANGEQVETSLAKAMAATTASQSVLYLTQVWHQAMDTQASLASLPLPDVNLSDTRKFLVQTADYAYQLARRAAAADRALNDGERAELRRLRDSVATLNETFHRVERRVATPGFLWTAVRPRRERTGPGGGVALAAAADFRDELGNLNERLQRAPALVYDGPFADTALSRPPQGLPRREVTPDAARRRAAAFLRSVGSSLPADATAQRLQGRIPAYHFAARPSRSGQAPFVQVSRMGGEVLTYLDPRPVQRVRLSRDEAERRALDFARKQGIPDPVITSSVLQGGRRIVALAPRQDGVVLYPAVVRLQVALDDGRILGYDAVGYWSARRHDRLPPATLSPAEAARRLPPGFQPSSSRLALIPLDTGREVLTYEFRGSAYGEDYLIYVNARTGEQENILRLVKTADGELAM